MRTILINRKGTLINLPIATSLALGGVIVGDNLTINASGEINLPVASTTQLGGIIVGANLSITNGVLNATGGSGSGTGEWGYIGGDLTKQTDLYFAFVTLNTLQTISAVKTFSVTPILSEASAILSFSSTTGAKQITTGGTTNFALMPGGNVGVKTTTPLEALQIGGSASANLGIRLNSAGDTYLKFREGAGDYGFTINYDGDGTNNLNILTHDNDVTGVVKVSIARSTGYVGIATAAPAYPLDVNGVGMFRSNLLVKAYLGTDNFVSETTGWRATYAGHLDMRSIFTNQMVAKSFIADLDLALLSGHIVTKSVTQISRDFTVVAVDSTVKVYVEALPGFPTSQVFADDDWVRFQVINRDGGLTWTVVWATVNTSTFTDEGGGEQSYTLTIKYAGALDAAVGEMVYAGGAAQDFGQSGDGFIQQEAASTYTDSGRPWLQVATWVTDPSDSDNITVRARLGNLEGITGQDGFGLVTRKDNDNYVSQWWLSDTDWGIRGAVAGSTVFQLGDTNEIAGFTIDAVEGIYAGTGATRVQMKVGGGFWAGDTAIGDAPFSVTNAGVLKAVSGTIGGWGLDTDAIYTGTKSTGDGLNVANDGITFADDGGIHAGNFYINADGEVGVKNLKFSYTKAGALMLDGDEISNPYNYPGKQGYILINQTLYDASQNISVFIGNGKGSNFFGVNTPADGDIVSYEDHTFQKEIIAESAGTFTGTLTANGSLVANSTFKTAYGRVKKITRITESTLLTAANHIVICNNTVGIEVDLPLAPVTGQEFVIKRMTASGVIVDGNGNNILKHDSATPVGTTDITGTRAWTLVYDGILWQAISST